MLMTYCPACGMKTLVTVDAKAFTQATALGNVAFVWEGGRGSQCLTCNAELNVAETQAWLGEMDKGEGECRA